MINRFGVKCDSPYNLSIYIDLNGNDKPNIIGRDIFVLTLTDRGLLPAGTDNTTNCTTKDETEFAGLQCANKVLQEEKPCKGCQNGKNTAECGKIFQA